MPTPKPDMHHVLNKYLSHGGGAERMFLAMAVIGARAPVLNIFAKTHMKNDALKSIYASEN